MADSGIETERESELPKVTEQVTLSHTRLFDTPMGKRGIPALGETKRYPCEISDIAPPWRSWKLQNAEQ